jgi:hypothetical protein
LIQWLDSLDHRLQPSANEKVQLPGRLQNRRGARNRDGGPVNCNALILFMALLGWAETCPKLVLGIETPSK